MNIYVAGVSGDTQYVKSLRTFYEIRLRPGDLKQERASGRGDVARVLACDDFLDYKEYGAISLFDLDMLHDPDVLERLRTDMEEHNLDMVTGHYYARDARYVHSIIWCVGNGKWPYMPMITAPRTGLHEVAITGMGCVLIKREVVEAVANYLPPGDHPFSIGPAPKITGDNRNLGTDHRFFSIARELGYKLWLDAGIESKHGTVFWMGRDIAEKLIDHKQTAKYLDAIAEHMRKVDGMDEKFLETRIEAYKARLKDMGAQLEQANKTADLLKRQMDATRVVISEDTFLLGKIKEGKAFPTVAENKREETLVNRTGLKDLGMEEIKEAREHVMQKEAKEFVEDLQVLRSDTDSLSAPN